MYKSPIKYMYTNNDIWSDAAVAAAADDDNDDDDNDDDVKIGG